MHESAAASADPRSSTNRARALARLLAAATVALVATLLIAAPAAAVTCSGSAPTTSRPGQVIVADSFESGSVSTHWVKTDEGDAWAGITTNAPHRGLCAGRITVTSSPTSRANLRHSLPSGTNEMWAIGWFRVDKQGYSGSNVPTFRFFNGSQRILDVFRSNGSGMLWIRTASGTGSWRYVWLGKYIELHRWYKIEIHVLTNWSSSTVSVRVNGTILYGNSHYYLPTSRLTTAMVGAEHVKQVGDLSFDDIILTVV